MKHHYLKVQVATTFLSLIGCISALPVLADCPHSMPSHMHLSCSSFIQNLSTTHTGTINSVVDANKSILPEERLALVQARIAKLDNGLIESLGKITWYQDLLFNDQTNSQKYASAIEAEQQKIAGYERDLSRTLNQEGDLKAQINKRIEQHPIENASSDNSGHETLN